MRRDELVRYLDGYLDVRGIDDLSWNGLQVEGGETVEHLAVAVDACDVIIDRAAEAGCDMLLVHHGMYWGKGFRLTGVDKRKVRALLDADLSVYAAHLPLDAHMEVGNNVELLRLIGARDLEPFGKSRSVTVGARGVLPRKRSLKSLVKVLDEGLGARSELFAFGEATSVREVAAISGSGGFGVYEAVERGVELLITGEWDYSKVHFAREHGLSVITSGHYNTETVGVQALARHLEAEHGLRWTYFDFPSTV